jgi:hypothetical protein
MACVTHAIVRCILAGLDVGVLSTTEFSIFVFMAIITTFATVPLVQVSFLSGRCLTV